MADTKVFDETERTAPDGSNWVRSVDATGSSGSDRKNRERTWANFMGHVVEGRLTLANGYSTYMPAAFTPSATDTGADTTDFVTAHGWITGTMVTPAATVGGLTVNTTYYINATDSDTVSYHTTYANAAAGTSKVNLTASITAEIIPIGVVSDTLYWASQIGHCVRLYNGAAWEYVDVSGLSGLVFSGLTDGKLYDAYIDYNAGTPQIVIGAAWTTDNVRAESLVHQDGVVVRSGDPDWLHVGTMRAVGTNTCEMSWGSASSYPKFFLWNRYNRQRFDLYRAETAASWTYNSTTTRQANGNALNQIAVVTGDIDLPVVIDLSVAAEAATGVATSVGIGISSTTVMASLTKGESIRSANAGVGSWPAQAEVTHRGARGYYFYTWLEDVSGATVSAFVGTNPSPAGTRSSIHVVIHG